MTLFNLKKKPLALPEEDGSTKVSLTEKLFVPIKEHPDVSRRSASANYSFPYEWHLFTYSSTLSLLKSQLVAVVKRGSHPELGEGASSYSSLSLFAAI